MRPASGLALGRGYFYSPARLIAVAEALNGNLEQARIDYAQAIDLLAKGPYRPEPALAHLGLAEVLLDHYPAARPKAIKLLDIAIGDLRQMKMQPSLERALKRKEILNA